MPRALHGPKCAVIYLISKIMGIQSCVRLFFRSDTVVVSVDMGYVLYWCCFVALPFPG